MLKIGHRGASGLAPENTKAAFKKAIELGMDMVELDIQVSKDKELVISHDNNLKRIAGIDQNISDLSLAEVKEIDIGSHFDKKFKEERILTLREVINLVKDKLKINIEVKSFGQDYKQAIERMISILEEEDFKDRVIISSFNHPLVKYIKGVDASLKTAVLIASLPVKPLEVIKAADADGVHSHHLVVNSDLVEQVKDEGLFINGWPVNEREEAERLKALGVDGIMTDYPNTLALNY